MKVIIVADASFCPTTKCFGYSIAVHSNKRLYTKDGFVDSAPSSAAAEMLATVIAIGYAIEKNLIKNSDTVTVYTDCSHVVSRIRGYPVKECLVMQEAHSLLTELLSAHDFRLKVEHVKGHQPSAMSNWLGRLHNQCDRAARAIMRKNRKES